MALTLPTAKGGNAFFKNPLEAGDTASLRQTTFKATQKVVKDADINIGVGDEQEINDAMAKLGMTTEMIQEKVAQEALNPATYRDYLNRKKGFLDTIRKDVLQVYLRTKDSYMALGFDEKSAEKQARAVALAHKDKQMGLFNTMYPNSGQKVKPVY